MRGWVSFGIAGLWVVGSLLATFVVAISLVRTGTPGEVLGFLTVCGVGILIMAYGVQWLDARLPKSPRRKPDGYIGKFRQPDGQLVHVARLETGTLMVISEEQPPRDLGTVTGPELTRWEKVGTTPD